MGPRALGFPVPQVTWLSAELLPATFAPPARARAVVEAKTPFLGNQLHINLSQLPFFI